MSQLGKQHESKPVTSSDKEMSKRHLAHRAEIDKLEEKEGKTDAKVLKKSIKYNESHLKEHAKALDKAKKEMAKRMK